MHLGQRGLKEAVDHQVKPLRAQLCCQRAGGHDVTEQHADLLALTLDRAADGQDLLADVPRGIAAGRRRGHRAPAARTEPGIRWQRDATTGTRNAQLRTAMHTEPRLARILMPPPRASHRRSPPGPNVTDSLEAVSIVNGISFPAADDRPEQRTDTASSRTLDLTGVMTYRTGRSARLLRRRAQRVSKRVFGREARSGRERQCDADDRRDGGRARHGTSSYAAGRMTMRSDNARYSA